MPIPAASVAPTLDELKVHLDIEADNTDHDDELLGMLDSAVAVVEGYVGPLDGRTLNETYYGSSPGHPILLRSYPVQSIESVTDVNGETFDADTYTVDLDTGRLWLSRWAGVPYGRASWGYGSYDITVTYTAGRATVPAPILSAILLVAGRLWETQLGNTPADPGPGGDLDGLDPSGLPLLPRHAQEQLRQYVRNHQVA